MLIRVDATINASGGGGHGDAAGAANGGGGGSGGMIVFDSPQPLMLGANVKLRANGGGGGQGASASLDGGAGGESSDPLIALLRAVSERAHDRGIVASLAVTLCHNIRRPLIAEMDPITAAGAAECVPARVLRAPDLPVGTPESGLGRQCQQVRPERVDLRLGRELEVHAIELRLIDRIVRRRRAADAAQHDCCQDCHHTVDKMLCFGHHDYLPSLLGDSSFCRRHASPS
jgi:hypothetical protein